MYRPQSFASAISTFTFPSAASFTAFTSSFGSVTVAPVSSAWTNGWTVTDAGGTVIRTASAVSNVNITGPVNIVFRGSGRLNAASMPTFQLTATGSGITSRCITIDLSGRPTTKATTCS